MACRPPVLRLVVLLVSLAAAARGDEVPSPEAHLGYRPGADFHLARWQTVVDYFKKVDAASDRVVVEELGQTTEGRPYIVATVSSAENVRKRAVDQRLQHRLADPRIEADSQDARDRLSASKPVVLITCSIHSTETASTLMAMELLHDLASQDDARTREILDNTILLLVPSANPDGVDKVASWYDRSRGHPWEGSGMPELYHKYAGHDTNRDWFMLNLKETRLLTRLLYKVWFPTVTYDVHQMGTRGARLFVPPFYDPINPNLDPRLHQSIALIGTHMAAELAAAGKRGVLTHAMYDNWWNGGNRTTPQRHNMVGVLTEAASVRMASPIFLEPDDLRGGSRGFPDHKPAINFVDPWPGGWWRLRDIIDYELISARALLTLAARYRGSFQGNYQAMALDAIAKGRSEPPYAWIVPADQRDPGRAADMVRILHETGIEVQQARSSFQAAGVKYPEGSWIMPAAQPYRTHLKDMMERQVYPPRFGPRGEAEPPYDVAGWTLPLQMGVRAVAVEKAFEADAETLEEIKPPKGQIVGQGKGGYFVLRNRDDDDFLVLNGLRKAGVPVQLALVASGHSEVPEMPPGSFVFEVNAKSRKVVEALLPHVSSKVFAVEKIPVDEVWLYRYEVSHIGVYQPWVPSMDEGWTRFVLDRFQFPYSTFHNADIQAGKLNDRIDTLLIPSIGLETLREGYRPNQTEPANVGGLGKSGAEAVREFVRQGGTLVCLEDACTYAIDVFRLPVKNVLKGLATSVFYGPGSLVRIEIPAHVGDSVSPLAYGCPEEGFAFFDRSLAFDVPNDPADSDHQVIARYASQDVLESGWLHGPERIQGKAALVDCKVGDGHVVLFGFPPQHRGQTRGTFRLLFNALLQRVDKPASAVAPE